MILNLPNDFPQPTRDGVVVLEHQEEQRTESGLIIATGDSTEDNEKKPMKVGYVCEIGPKVTTAVYDPETQEERIIQPGDRVGVNHYVNSGFYHKGDEFLFCSEMDVLTIFPSKDTILTMGERLDRRRAAVELRKKALQ